jgi:hypothetical protein
VAGTENKEIDMDIIGEIETLEGKCHADALSPAQVAGRASAKAALVLAVEAYDAAPKGDNRRELGRLNDAISRHARRFPELFPEDEDEMRDIREREEIADRHERYYNED